MSHLRHWPADCTPTERGQPTYRIPTINKFHKGCRRISWTFDALIEQLPERQACKITVELLALAHDRGCERELAEELARTLDARKLPDLAALRAVFGPDPDQMPIVHVQLASLNGYEALIGAAYAGEVA